MPMLTEDAFKSLLNPDGIDDNSNSNRRLTSYIINKHQKLNLE